MDFHHHRNNNNHHHHQSSRSRHSLDPLHDPSMVHSLDPSFVRPKGRIICHSLEYPLNPSMDPSDFNISQDSMDHSMGHSMDHSLNHPVDPPFGHPYPPDNPFGNSHSRPLDPPFGYPHPTDNPFGNSHSRPLDPPFGHPHPPDNPFGNSHSRPLDPPFGHPHPTDNPFGNSHPRRLDNPLGNPHPTDNPFGNSHPRRLDNPLGNPHSGPLDPPLGHPRRLDNPLGNPQSGPLDPPFGHPRPVDNPLGDPRPQQQMQQFQPFQPLQRDHDNSSIDRPQHRQFQSLHTQLRLRAKLYEPQPEVLYQQIQPRNNPLDPQYQQLKYRLQQQALMNPPDKAPKKLSRHKKKMMAIEEQLQWEEDYLEKTFSDYLGCHPTYCIPLVRAHNFIMRDIGPLIPAVRYYIGMLACARHRCTFLVSFLKRKFIKLGGDEKWLLNGLESAPPKIRSLNDLNKILAHQPWLVKVQHIQHLTRHHINNSWSIPELTQAIIIMAHFHSICTIAFGCKFGFAEPEYFHEESTDEELEIEEVRYDLSGGPDKIKKIIKRSPASKLILERCKRLEQENANLAKIMVNSFDPHLSGKNRRRLNRRFQIAFANYNNSKQDNSAGGEGQGGSGQGSSGQNPNDGEYRPNTWSEDEWIRLNYDMFVEDPEFCYIDFAKRDPDTSTSTYRIQDYGWDDQGYSLCNSLYHDVSSFLDEKFKVGYNLTYYTLGPKTNVDTSPFRRAVWNYIQSIYGVRHDDYNYREVNILLERNLKCFIKHLACFPELTYKNDFRQVMKGFRASEKIHVIIMVAEARLQSEILYAMRALMEYQKICS